MATGDQYRRIEPSDMLVFDGENNLVGIRSGKSDSAELRLGAPLTAQQVGALAAVADQATGGGGQIAVEDATPTEFPAEKVLIAATGSPCGSPCTISRIRCVTGTSVALTVYDNPAASSGTTLYSGTLSAGAEAVIAASIRAINGLRAVFASGSFEFFLQQEAA